MNEPLLSTAAPPTLARVLALAAIVFSGLLGGLIGYGLGDVMFATDSKSIAPALGALLGSVGFAAGVAVVVVLALRAMTEWSKTSQ